MLNPERTTAESGVPNVRLYKGIFDERYGEARAFGEQLARSGVVAQPFGDGDITSFWFDELDLLWRDNPVAIAGLTQFGPMFVLERLGRERGLQMVLRVEHRPEEGGLMRHLMSGPAQTLDVLTALSMDAGGWPSVMAGAVTGCRSNCSALAEHSLVVQCPKPVLGGGILSCTPENAPERIIHYYMTEAHREGRELPLDGPLFTWVIAPKVRA
jgi:hypothetical protein